MKYVLPTILTLGTSFSAHAAVLDFDGDICNGGNVCLNGDTLDQSYGDILGADVQYDGNTDSAGLQTMYFWADYYSDLTNVAYGDSGFASSLFIVAQAGFEVSLDSFAIGAWRNQDRTSQVTVREIGGSELLNTGPIVIDGQVSSLFNINASSASGFEINFGPDAHNVGIDNVIYSANRIDPIPLPASALLLGAGLMGLGSLRRRKAV